MTHEPGVDAVLEALYDHRGLDFRHYRRSTIERRLHHRLVALHIPDYLSYLAVLASDPCEFDRLVANLTLKVTGFFRNPSVYALLRSTVLPALLKVDGEIKIWCAGCATGEEAYSVAMEVSELAEGYCPQPNIAIVGTDIDHCALETAEAARYSEPAVSDLSADRLERYFAMESDGRRTYYVVRKGLRDSVFFTPHNLADAMEAPGRAGESGFDLILCRNVLIYFERSLQERVVQLLHHGLRPGGYLVLGEAESLPLPMEHHYVCIDRRARVYQKPRM